MSEHRPKQPKHGRPDQARLDRVVADAQRERERRDRGYRELSLKLHGWVCARCGREFTRANLHELTVHHRDHDHDHNPPDGSNWENLCVYCHENEHARTVQQLGVEQGADSSPTTHQPFAGLADLLKRGDG